MTNKLTRELLIAEISKNLLPQDADFVNSLNELLRELGETNFLNIALSCFQRGSEHLQAKRYDLAKIDFDRTISLNPQADAYYQRAIATYHLQDYHSAIADLDKAIALQPQRAEFHDLRGDTYLKLSNYELALANYNQAVTLGFPNQKLTDLQREWNNKLQQEEARKRAEAEEARKRAEAEEARKRAEAEEARKRAEAEEARKRAEAEEARKRREAEEARKRREAEEARKRAEAEAEAARQKAEEERKKREAEAKFPQLAQFLAQGEWRKADEETNRVMCKIMGRESEGYLTDDNCRNFPREELKIIDALWVKYSKGKFGFSVQKQIYIDCGGTPGEYNRDAWYKLADTVGWRKGGSWLNYSDYTFNTNTSQVGHLPTPHFWGFMVGCVFLFSRV